MTDDPILGINAERAAAQRRVAMKHLLRQRGVDIPRNALHNEAALKRLCAKQAPVLQGRLDLA